MKNHRVLICIFPSWFCVFASDEDLNLVAMTTHVHITMCRAAVWNICQWEAVKMRCVNLVFYQFLIVGEVTWKLSITQCKLPMEKVFALLITAKVMGYILLLLSCYSVVNPFWTLRNKKKRQDMQFNKLVALQFRGVDWPPSASLTSVTAHSFLNLRSTVTHPPTFTERRETKRISTLIKLSARHGTNQPPGAGALPGLIMPVCQCEHNTKQTRIKTKPQR